MAKFRAAGDALISGSAKFRAVGDATGDAAGDAPISSM